jgi:hypothetical protein
VANVSEGHCQLLATAGTTYHLRVGGGAGAAGGIRIAVIAPPANDAFAARALISGRSASVAAYDHLATTEPGEPAEWTGGRTLWWTWTAPDAGVAEVSLFNSEFTRAAKVYTGETLATLRPVAVSAAHTAVAPLKWRAEKGRNYHLAAGAQFGTPPGRMELELNLFPAPPLNDGSSRPARLEGVEAAFSGAIYGATRQSGEARPGPETGPGPAAGRTTWHVWRPAFSGHAAAVVGGRGFAPLMSVYQGGTRLADGWADGTQPTNVAAAWFGVTAGKEYRIQVDAQDAATNVLAGGAYRLELALWTLRLASPASNAVLAAPDQPVFAVAPPNPAVDGELAAVTYLDTHETQAATFVPGGAGPDFAVSPTNLPPGDHVVIAVATNTAGRGVVSLPVKFTVRPANDAFAHATVLTGYAVSNLTSFRAATREPTEPRPHADGTGATVWYRWTAPASGTAEVAGASLLAMYRGTELGRLTRLTGQPGPFGNSLVSFTVEEGKTYSLALERQQDGPGMAWYDPFEREWSLRLRTLRLASPGDGTYGVDASGVRLEAVVTERPGRMEAVEFLVDGAVLATVPVEASRARFHWEGMLPGEYTVQARARLSDGQVQLTPVHQVRISPANDEFARRPPLPGSTGSVFTHLYLAGREPDEPAPPFGTAAGTLWWSFTAPADGLLRVTSLQLPYHGGLAAYSGHRLDLLRPVAWQEFLAGGQPGYAAALTNGQTVALMIGAPHAGRISFDWRFAAHPENDAFSRAIVLPPDQTEVPETDLNGATLEPAEAGLHPVNVPRASRWWRFDAPGPGAFLVGVSGDLAGAWITAYAGKDPASLVLLGGSAPWIGRPRFAVMQAGPVWLALNHFGAADERAGFSVAFEPVSPNDAFTNRLSVAGTSFSLRGQTLGASREPTEPALAGGAGASLWWSWTAPADGLLRIAGGGAAVGFYRGDSLAGLAPLPVHAMPVPSGGIVRVGEGEVVHLQIESPAGQDYPLSVHFEFVPNPANDAFARAEELGGFFAEATTSLWAATLEAGEPVRPGDTASVWYRWQAPADGRLRVRPRGVSSALGIPVYHGRGLGELELRGVMRPSGPFEVPELEVRAGEELYLVVSGPAVPEAAGLALMLAPQAGPRLTGLERRPEGAWQACLLALPDSGFIIERSNDLVRWQEVVRDRAGNWARMVELPVADEGRGAFFRARPTP